MEGVWGELVSTTHVAADIVEACAVDITAMAADTLVRVI